MNLLALADFDLVATHRGFSQVSRMAGRPKATLARRVDELETTLGVRLLERHFARPTSHGGGGAAASAGWPLTGRIGAGRGD